MGTDVIGKEIRRKKRVKVFLDRETIEKLEELSEMWGMSLSGTIRFIIQDYARIKFGRIKKKKKIDLIA